MVKIDELKISEFQNKLLNWFLINQRKFQWRNPQITSYEAVIAEVLLQRTRAETISRFYDSFVKKLPNWEAIHNAKIEVIETLLQPIGLHKQRANRLKKLAEEMVNRNGVLPKDRKELESIPFLGQYIANAIELIVFGNPKPLLDVNMSRLLERYFGPRKLADIRYDPYLQDLAHNVVIHENSIYINWAILDFAAIICKPKPQCQICIFAEKCAYFNMQEKFVLPKK